jgi:ADP-heptose:LPS heptosyltransferase
MSEIGIDFSKHGCKDPVAHPQNLTLRQWAGVIAAADYFLGCDSVGQHIACSLDKPATVVVGSTFAVNVSYPDYEKFDVLDMGGSIRKYSPIRITMDEVADRGNDGIMNMNEAIEKAIVESVDKGIKKFSSDSATSIKEISSTNTEQGCAV